MSFIVSTSAHGTHHQSKLEALAADRWIPLGILPHDKPLPSAIEQG